MIFLKYTKSVSFTLLKAFFAATCALNLRRQQSLAWEMKVFLNTNPHCLQDTQYFRSICLQMDAATNSTPELIKYALKALDIIFKEGISYMKCGTKLYNLIPKDTVQLNMFSIADPRAKQISAAVDKVNLAKGKGLVRFGIQGFEQSYKARTEHLSPFFTTRIDQIIKIKN